MKPLVEGEEISKPLAPLTSWHIGGQAERYYCPNSQDALSHYLHLLPENTPLTWLGLGSNVLILDGGIKGAVIGTTDLQELYAQPDGTIVAQAGVACAKLARFCCKLGLPDAAFFAGIPGTVGGALSMNAGAFSGQTWEWVQQVIVMDRRGQIAYRSPKDFTIGYRSVKGLAEEQKDEAFVGAIFKFLHQPGVDGMQKIKELLRKRKQSQPIGTFNCGSVYRNPDGDFAARLIEECGLKGHTVGAAMVSPKHANFIINSGQALANDVETLMSTIESAVHSRFGIELKAEVRILGQREK
jgi:UDP-N-acetylmuramate dehydrogenase